MPPPVALQILCGLSNIPPLGVFIAANQKQDKSVLFLGEIDSIPWPAVEAQFPYTFAKTLVVAKVAQAGAVKPDPNLRPAICIPQGFKPFPERRGAFSGFVVVNGYGKTCMANFSL